jgi:LAS superfamily LD-carboxypeptidase LdcB
MVAFLLPDPVESPPTDPTEETDPPIVVGFFTEGDQTFYRTESGALHTGWLELNNTRYYLDENGVLQTGWQSIDGETYYLNTDGSICRGQVEIENQTYHFTASGVYVVMANPWHKIPENYEATLVIAENNYQVDANCVDALLQMLTDCRAEGLNAQITSAYRSHDHQVRLFERKVNYYIGLGYSKEQAEKKAGTSVAVPGTSEHELGLAVDLVDANYWVLDEKQANTAAQKWLMEHCWEYGFILRYPSGKSDSTGIIYEPWHYRYVGTALAKELQNSGLCLEEYFLSLQ